MRVECRRKFGGETILPTVTRARSIFRSSSLNFAFVIEHSGPILSLAIQSVNSFHDLGQPATATSTSIRDMQDETKVVTKSGRKALHLHFKLLIGFCFSIVAEAGGVFENAGILQ